MYVDPSGEMFIGSMMSAMAIHNTLSAIKTKSVKYPKGAKLEFYSAKNVDGVKSPLDSWFLIW